MSEKTDSATQTLPAPAMPPKRIGRPSSFTPEIGELICDKVAAGLSVAQIAGTTDDETGLKLPTAKCIHQWVRMHEPFGSEYARAKLLMAEKFALDCISIADAPAESMIDVQKQRLRCDSRRWAAGRLAPASWGDRVGLDIQGEITQTNQGDTLAIARSILDVLSQASLTDVTSELPLLEGEIANPLNDKDKSD